ncbi:MAG TPA: nitroreductase [Devosia sp.]|nr:nitroreductase [Devosia sp.]
MAENKEVLDYLATRRSTPVDFLGAPGPTEGQLAEILKLGVRVPDHAKLNPWRLVIYQGDARAAVGEKLAQIARVNNPQIDEKELETERNRFLPAPLTIGVLSSPVEHFKVPEFEQLLSSAGVALNLLHAANAAGFAAHWVTRWFAYDKAAASMLGAKPGERFVAFVHIGTPTRRLEDKPTPDMKKIVTRWAG